jgi:hypothetical protein
VCGFAEKKGESRCVTGYYYSGKSRCITEDYYSGKSRCITGDYYSAISVRNMVKNRMFLELKFIHA